MKKNLAALILTGLVALSAMGTAGAAEQQPAARTADPVHAEEAVPRAEQTKWYHRTYNGKCQKRLWSITENKWLTDWIDC